jgi:glycosyltransferase involved in cell wall biosynthesis
VLCVGSHEPRKNHLAVLEAAERTWRAGLDFGLLFVGGHSWRAEEFGWRLDQLRAAGRPVATRAKVSEALLWASYREARCVMFPSLNEGFGLPVAESLSVGTPVITSDFGSMRELARHGGALLVDPRDDEALTDALASVLSDDTLHARLRSEALAVPRRSWDTYAAQAWDALLATD